jgi:hypothetical protein
VSESIICFLCSFFFKTDALENLSIMHMSFGFFQSNRKHEKMHKSFFAGTQKVQLKVSSKD